MTDCILTAYELQIVCAIANGKTRTQYADSIGKSVRAIHSMISIICHKLDTTDVQQAVFACWRNGWLTICDTDVKITDTTIPSDQVEDHVAPEVKLYNEALVRAIRTNTASDHLESRILLRIVRRKAAERSAGAAR